MMRNHFRAWMLPEGVVEALPVEAAKLNALEQIAMTTFSEWGYQPLRPPLLEYADTFIADDPNGELGEQTIQFKDQKSGRQLGIRADITPQIARIDAHYLKTDQVARYAYKGEVVRSYPTGHGNVRNPSVAGVELLGSHSWQADVEIVSLLIEYLERIQLNNYIIELGSIDIVVELLKAFAVPINEYPQIFQALARKDREKLIQLGTHCQLSPEAQKELVALTSLYGEIDILDAVKTTLGRHDGVIAAVDALFLIAEQIQTNYPVVNLRFDLSDVRGYGYHNGLIFSAYVDGLWQSIARGGRYDSFGNHFADKVQQRASIGFNCHLNLLARLINRLEPEKRVICYALSGVSTQHQQTLQQYVKQLRKDGEHVVCCFDDDILPTIRYTHRIIRQGDDWVVVPAKDKEI